MIYTDHFLYRPNQKALPNEADCSEPEEILEALIGFIHAEDSDEENASATEKKLVKNLKWGARKNGTRRIVLHSFSHLAESKASPEFTKDLIQRTEQRLLAAHYEAYTTPFGYFLDLDLKAPGRSAARIFASF